MASKWQSGSLFCLFAILLNVFLCLCLEQSGARNAYPGERSQATEMANVWGCNVGISTNLSLSSLGVQNTVIMTDHIRLFTPLSLFFWQLILPSYFWFDLWRCGSLPTAGWCSFPQVLLMYLLRALLRTFGLSWRGKILLLWRLGWPDLHQIEDKASPSRFWFLCLCTQD